MSCLIDVGPHGRRLLCGLLLCCLAAGPALAQTPDRPATRPAVRAAADMLRMRQALSADVTAAAAPDLRRPAARHYDVVALRVEFQPDTTRYTTGDGTFAGELYEDGLRPDVDPLPHDAAYFDAHLAFLQDYVGRVSDGRTTLTTHLVPEVVRLSKPMGAYSPTGLDYESDAEMAKLASLVTEAWTLADAQSAFDLSGFDPEATAFVLFHAGVGRDFELVGTTLDKTPQDLPSLFFDQNALERLLGPVSVSFGGVPVRHTMIVPRTETRRGFDFIQDEPFLLELSINGMLAANFFSYLGVPDLFDAETGESAIGPFGLMDPLGISAYYGLFPPEPMAWTKYYLGWGSDVGILGGIEPIGYSLKAASLAGSSERFRAAITDAEYFLVENRHRDPEGDGLTLRVWQDGRVVEQHVANDDSTFNGFTIEGFTGGVVVGVDNYDWALPGGVDEDGVDLVGGILIWHIDERRLRAGFAANRVNADPQRRAIDLEEADGAQDIGFPSGNPFGPDVHLGSPFDFYYAGNPVEVVTQFGQSLRLYENRFGPDTFPSSNSNEGGPSFIVLEDFSTPAPEMTFAYRHEAEAGITPRPYVVGQVVPGTYGAGSSIASSGNDGPAGADTLIFVHEAVSEGQGLLSHVETLAGRRLPVDVYAATKPAVEGGEAFAVAVPAAGATPYLVHWRADASTVRIDLPDDVRGMQPISPVVEVQEGAQRRRYVAFAGAGTPQLVVQSGGQAVTQDVPGLRAVAVAGGRLARVTNQGVYLSGDEEAWPLDLAADERVGQPVFGSDAEGLVGVMPRLDRKELRWLYALGAVPVSSPVNDASASEQTIDVAAYYARLKGSDPAAALSPYPVLADLDADGRLDVLVTYGDLLMAFTQGGALVAGFPIRLAAPVTAQPLVAKLTDSGAWSVLVAATDGYVYAYDLGRRGDPVPGFPLAAGRRIEATPLLQGQALYVVSVDGALRAWELSGTGDVWWGQLYGDAHNTSFVALTGDVPLPETGALLVASETYNWPNPIRDGFTHLTYETTDDARLDILIVDAAGSVVDEITVENVRGGVPGEYRWQTDAGSGLYFARVTATAADGRRETRIVKMAIIR